MSAEPDFLAGNSESNAKLRALVGRLTDADLGRDLGEGWTVAAMLAHLALVAATAADERVAAIDADLLARIDAAGRPITLNRAAHRREHITQIETAIGRPAVARRTGPAA